MILKIIAGSLWYLGFALGVFILYTMILAKSKKVSKEEAHENSSLTLVLALLWPISLTVCIIVVIHSIIEWLIKCFIKYLSDRIYDDSKK